MLVNVCQRTSPSVAVGNDLLRLWRITFGMPLCRSPRSSGASDLPGLLRRDTRCLRCRSLGAHGRPDLTVRPSRLPIVSRRPYRVPGESAQTSKKAGSLDSAFFNDLGSNEDHSSSVSSSWLPRLASHSAGFSGRPASPPSPDGMSPRIPSEATVVAPGRAGCSD